MEKPQLIQALEKELNITFKQVSVEKIRIWEYEKAAEYTIGKNNKIIGLRITRFSLKELPISIKDFQNLEILDLSFNELTDISVLSHLPKLTNLYLVGNELSDISVLSYLPNLTNLYLGVNHIYDISVLSYLPKLTNLSLGVNQLTDISVLSYLPNLINLNLGGNQLTDISVLSHLSNLTNLNLGGNQIYDISILSHLSKLTSLNLGGNKLSDISVLSYLPNLRTLDLVENELSDISVLSHLPKLTSLNLGGNELFDISALSHLPKLTSLNLGGNELSDISALSHLPKLTSLNLGGNELSDISVLSHLPKLTELYLWSNELTDISVLKNLKNLKILDLQSNDIEVLPEWIVDFSNMGIQWKEYFGGWEDINLYNNPLQEPPIEIVKQGKEAVRNYFKKKNAEGTDYLYEAKLILVGEERAGKTTIAKALTQANKFKINLNEVSTHGIDIVKWIIPKNKTKTPKDFRFNVWDFGGQDIYHATHQFFLTKRSLYLFLTEARKDLRFDDFYYWLNIINTLGGNSPILAIKNKIDQSSVSNDISKYKELFPQLLNDTLIGVSCNTTHEKWETEYFQLLNIFKEKLYDVVKNKQIESMGTPLPKTWVKVRQEITKLQDQGIDYIPFADYQTICRKYNLDDITISSLSQLFHDLGVFFHFQNNIKLRNTIFLNHEYVTQGVYKIFDDKNIIESNGEFTEQDLIEVLQNTPYEHKQAELLSLCEEFKILFKKGKQYLAPQLFEEKKPDVDWDFTNNLHYKYSYGFMPKGIVSYLIVAMHEKIYQHHYWRYGVELCYEDTFALVEEKRLGKRNQIDIRIRGRKKNEFLTIIREQLNGINNKFTNLQIKEEVGCICEECIVSEKPYLFDLDRIEKAINKRILKLQCQNSFINVDIEKILGYYDFKKLDEDRITKNELRKGFDRIHNHLRKQDSHLREQDKILINISSQIDQLETDLLSNLSEILKAEFETIKLEIDNLSKENGEAIAHELMTSIAKEKDKMTTQQREILEKLNQSSENWQAKVRFSIPVLKQLGVDIGCEYELNNIVKGIGTKLKSWLERSSSSSYPQAMRDFK